MHHDSLSVYSCYLSLSRRGSKYRAQVRANLQALGNKISAQFKQALLQSFETTWLAAAIGSVLGLVLSFVTLVFRRKKPTGQMSSAPSSEAAEVPTAL